MLGMGQLPCMHSNPQSNPGSGVGVPLHDGQLPLLVLSGKCRQLSTKVLPTKQQKLQLQKSDKIRETNFNSLS